MMALLPDFHAQFNSYLSRTSQYHLLILTSFCKQILECQYEVPFPMFFLSLRFLLHSSFRTKN